MFQVMMGINYSIMVCCTKNTLLDLLNTESIDVPLPPDYWCLKLFASNSARFLNYHLQYNLNMALTMISEV